MLKEQLKVLELTLWIPKYLTSFTHGIIWPDKLTTLAHEISWRGPIRTQDDFLKSICMSRFLISHSQSCSKFSNAVTVGANDKISSAYKIIYRLQLGSSKYIANRNGDKTDACLTPDSIRNTVDQEFPHLIQVQHPRNRFSIISRIGTGIYVFSLI